MRIIKPSFEYVSAPDGATALRNIEMCGRTCYKSEDKMTDESAARFIAMIIKSGHTSVLEHEKVTVKIVCDRGVTHEIVRHRMASYSQESTRYCNYSKDKFGNELTFIEPCFLERGTELYSIWEKGCRDAEENYFAMIKAGAKAEEARSLLPNSIKTEIAVTMNFREWRHFFGLRLSSRAHPQMREIALMLFEVLKSRYPVIFDDIKAE